MSKRPKGTLRSSTVLRSTDGPLAGFRPYRRSPLLTRGRFSLSNSQCDREMMFLVPGKPRSSSSIREFEPSSCGQRMSTTLRRARSSTGASRAWRTFGSPYTNCTPASSKSICLCLQMGQPSSVTSPRRACGAAMLSTTFQALVQELRGGSGRDVALAEDSSAYIDDFLGPLFREMCESCRGTVVNQPSMRLFLPLAERLHVAILSLAWALEAV